MKQSSKKSSSEKENRKVSDKTSRKSSEIREDKNNSIRNDPGSKLDYPYQQVHDKQFGNQPEFIDRNNDSKDKS
ncbi:MAG TPA: hypothetical protein VEV83_16305 [Parafilimonas sp.]|nr:hypothetical protein [Parafilimonas sp.]